jgi:hypothetical protein
MLTCQAALANNDETTRKIDAIRSEILSWIIRGSAQGLILPPELEYQQYVSKMTSILSPQPVVIESVTTQHEAQTTDEEQKVMIDGQFKTCRGFRSMRDNRYHIVCNVERFRETPKAGLFRLIHHEFAGLVRIEKNEGAASDYAVSDQLTDFFAPESSVKLADHRALDTDAKILRDVLSNLKNAIDHQAKLPFTLDGERYDHALQFNTKSFIKGDEIGTRCPTSWIIQQTISDGSFVKNFTFDIDLSVVARGGPIPYHVRKELYEDMPAFHQRRRDLRHDEFQLPAIILNDFFGAPSIRTTDGFESHKVMLLGITIPIDNDDSASLRLDEMQQAIVRFQCLYRRPSDLSSGLNEIGDGCEVAAFGAPPLCATGT